MIAHIRRTDKAEQSIKLHSENTARLCEESTRNIKFGRLAYLIGLLHDMGKYTQKFKAYLYSQSGYGGESIRKGEVVHSPTGAIFAFQRWYNGDFYRECTAQLISMVISAHHSGLYDILSLDEKSPFHDMLVKNKTDIFYDEAVGNFTENVAGIEALDGLFDEAAAELKAAAELILKNQKSSPYFYVGMIAREMLSVLVDSDRFDSACFEYRANPFEPARKADWKAALTALETHLSKIGKGKLSELRGEISDACIDAANKSGRLYRLTVPTGGGKTFASLRYALKYADLNNAERIFYIIPYNTILDQNAKDMRTALNGTLRILEHHSNVVFDGDKGAGEYENYRLLTERWTGSDLILTSMVQLLNSLFRAENTNARRMCRLANSVIIFDEIQALPKKCTVLFERAINFFIDLAGCTVVLCTATQPNLTFTREPVEMFGNPSRLFETLRRTELINETGRAIDICEAAEKAVGLVKAHNAILMIVNTKKAAQAMYNEMKERGIPSIHLSTDMYPAHRMEIINSIIKRDDAKPLFCVSTALIEAGINISFPCVIRSLAGIGSIIQAAGRCNRNAELPDGQMGKVYIWKLQDENLEQLAEIKKARDTAYGILEKYGANIDTLEGISSYFEKEREAFASELNYPIEGGSYTLVDILDRNIKVNSSKYSNVYILRGAYRTAGENFKVIDEDTRAVLIPIGRGEEIYHRLCENLSMGEKITLLREAQSYSVSLYTDRYVKLYEIGAIAVIEDSGVSVLRREYYNPDTGVSESRGTPELLSF